MNYITVYIIYPESSVYMFYLFEGKKLHMEIHIPSLNLNNGFVSRVHVVGNVEISVFKLSLSMWEFFVFVTYELTIKNC